MQCSEEKKMTVHSLASLGISNAHGRLEMPKADWAIGMAQYVWLLLLLLFILLLLLFCFFLLWHKTGVMSWRYKQSSTASLEITVFEKSWSFLLQIYCFLFTHNV